MIDIESICENCGKKDGCQEYEQVRKAKELYLVKRCEWFIKRPCQKMWISVNNFLPEERENPITMDYYQYPVTFQNGDVTDIRYYKFGDGHWWHGSQKMDEYVTAWMPLPEPYREEGAE